jgi:hypothetical protein
VTRYIEYYEVKTRNGYEYYFMPVDPDAKNKENFDNLSHRIWKFDTKTNRIEELRNIKAGKPSINLAELLKIQLMAKSVPYSDYYLASEEMRRYREQREAEESAAEDQV